MEEIKITIHADGTMDYIVSGVKGASCKELTKAIDQMTKGGKGGNTPEFFEEKPNKNQLFNQRF